MKWLHPFLCVLVITSTTNAILQEAYLEQFRPLLYKSQNRSEYEANSDHLSQGYISYTVASPFRSTDAQKYHKLSFAEKRQNNLMKWDKYPYGFNQELKRAFNKRIFLESTSNKKVVSQYEMGMFPYNNVVKLSAGCTGTLLTPRHVLTAAHCVHDGKDFKDNMEMLKVEVADRVGYRIHYIVKINVPVLWLKTQTLPEIGRGAFDYAVLQLNLPVSGRDKFMPLSLPSIKSLNSNLEFLGFKLGRAPALWLSKCGADRGVVVMRGNVALRTCESSSGNSGAAAFAYSHVEGNKIIGLLSNKIQTAEGQFTPQSIEYEAIMLLTLPKCLDICAMIHPEGDKYDICKTVKRNNVQYLEVGATRIMPFFG